ncbi:MAG: hypothetical protein ACR2N7_00425 [Acidimicrobiia bacterium]
MKRHIGIAFAAIAVATVGCSTSNSNYATTSAIGTVDESTTTTAGAQSPTTTSSTTSTAPPTTIAAEPKTIFGVWRTGGGYYLTLSPGGKSTISETAVGRPFGRSSFTIDGEQELLLTFETPDGQEASGGDAGTYRIALSEDGDSLSFERLEDECDERALDFAKGPLVRHDSG